MGIRELQDFVEGDYGSHPRQALGSRLQARRAAECGDLDLALVLSTTREELAALLYLLRYRDPVWFIEALHRVLHDRVDDPQD